MARSPVDIVEALQRHRSLGAQLSSVVTLPAHGERFGDPEPPLQKPLRNALANLGIDRLWSHQAAGLTAVRSGRSTLVTTPTASGKSLVFHLPVVEEELVGGAGKALFLYPLKALGQDQLGKFQGLAVASGLDGGPSLCAIYDGDTTQRDRARIKRRFPRVVISNPDMLHLGILGSWQAWEPFLADLRWIVLDELHTYRGIFGSHFHHVHQRLIRLCRALGSAPVVIASSATAANAGEFAETLLRRPFEWISDSGAPRPARRFLLFQPAASPYTLTLELFAELLRRGLKTIVFTKARRITELLISWFRQQEPGLARHVAGYRSGFLPSERRQIEKDLFTGRLEGVISTSALEMGVDVGGLDACILVGFPGSVMATWQRSGRVGRGDRESITAMVALPDALDQYFLGHPTALVERPCEQLIVDPRNEPVSRSHLLCAAAEKPLSLVADREYVEPLTPIVDGLVEDGLLERLRAGDELHAVVGRPHRDVSLRGSGESTTIVEAGSGRVVGTVDGVRVLHECHPGAIYLHQGRQFLVRELDLGAKRVLAEAVSVDYYTSPLTEKDTAVLETLDERVDDSLAACLGRLRVTEKVVGYERRRVKGQDVLGQHHLELPPVSYETVGLWWIAPPTLEEELRSAGFHFMGALHAAEHATISLLPLFALCDRGDIGGISIPLHEQLGCGAVFVYDGHPGGVGIAARAFRDLPELLERVRVLIADCECDDGCPSCIQSPKCGNGNRPLDKEGAHRFLEALRSPSASSESMSARPIRPAEEMEELPPPSAVPGPTVGAVTEKVSVADGSRPRTESDDVETGRRDSQRTMLVWLETRHSSDAVGGLGNAHMMRCTAAAVCHLEAGRIEVFAEDEVAELVTLLGSAELVVGFDVVRVIYPILAGYTGIDYQSRWPTLDLRRDLEGRHDHPATLESLVTATLGPLDGESTPPEGAATWAGDRCRQTVEKIRDLYLFGRRMGHIMAEGESGARPEERRQLAVDW
ncbi:MAG: DUF1998 domain-containing protein [Acidobacteriota bacterium]|nr:DUF1998 domain-containing protein [Acidobacteriota bacterium]